MTCDRCFGALETGDHGEGVCPYEPRASQRAFITDELPGGPKFFENLGPEKVWVESKSQLRDEMRARGLRAHVRHVGVPGSDKSRETSKWY